MSSNPASRVARAEYLRALREARNLGGKLSSRQLKDLRFAYSRAIRNLFNVTGNEMTVARAESLKRQLKGVMDGLAGISAKSAADSGSRTIQQVLQAHDKAYGEFASLSGSLPSIDFARINEGAAQAIAFRRGGITTTKLIGGYAKRIRTMANEMLTASVSIGTNVTETVTDVARLLASGDLRTELAKIPRFSKLARQGVRGADLLTKYGIDPSKHKDVINLYSATRRLVLTETGNALREANAVALESSPVVEAAGWQTSGAHPEPDECDVLAEVDMFGLGEGFWPPDQWPTAPHPHCLCYQGQVKIRPPSQWSKPRPAYTRPPNFRSKVTTASRRVLGKGGAKFTPGKLERVVTAVDDASAGINALRQIRSSAVKKAVTPRAASVPPRRPKKAAARPATVSDIRQSYDQAPARLRQVIANPGDDFVDFKRRLSEAVVPKSTTKLPGGKGGTTLKRVRVGRTGRGVRAYYSPSNQEIVISKEVDGQMKKAFDKLKKGLTPTPEEAGGLRTFIHEHHHALSGKNINLQESILYTYERHRFMEEALVELTARHRTAQMLSMDLRRIPVQIRGSYTHETATFNRLANLLNKNGSDIGSYGFFTENMPYYERLLATPASQRWAIVEGDVFKLITEAYGNAPAIKNVFDVAVSGSLSPIQLNRLVDELDKALQRVRQGLSNHPQRIINVMERL